MKNSFFLYLLIISFAVIFYSCDDSGLVETDKTTEVTGTVNGWTLGTKILKAVVRDSAGTSTFLADSTTISSSGAFTLKMKFPPDNYPWLYKSNDTACTHHAVITPADLKYCLVYFNVYNDTNGYVGSITRKNFSITPAPGGGSYQVQYMYFSTDATIVGNDTCSTGTIRTSVNLTGSKAWNKAAIVFNTYNPPFLVDVNITNTEPNGGWWAFGP